MTVTSAPKSIFEFITRSELSAAAAAAEIQALRLLLEAGALPELLEFGTCEAFNAAVDMIGVHFDLPQANRAVGAQLRDLDSDDAANAINDFSTATAVAAYLLGLAVGQRLQIGGTR